MNQLIPTLRRLRSLKATLVACLAICYWPSAIAAAPAAAAVATIEQTRVADLVMLDRGFNAGLRQGMVCRVTRGTTEIAEVLLVELRPTCSAALILNVAPKHSIRAGDVASIKILKT